MRAKTPDKLRILAATVLLLLLSTAQMVSAQELGNGGDTLPQPEIDRIIKAFTTKERQFRQALNEYSFQRDAILQSVGMGGQITGEYHRVSLFTFDNEG